MTSAPRVLECAHSTSRNDRARRIMNPASDITAASTASAVRHTRILLHCPDITLKGKNQGDFQQQLERNLRRRLHALGLDWPLDRFRVFVRPSIALPVDSRLISPCERDGDAHDGKNERQQGYCHLTPLPPFLATVESCIGRPNSSRCSVTKHVAAADGSFRAPPGNSVLEPRRGNRHRQPRTPTCVCEPSTHSAANWRY